MVALFVAPKRLFRVDVKIRLNLRHIVIVEFGLRLHLSENGLPFGFREIVRCEQLVAFAAIVFIQLVSFFLLSR